MRLISAVVLCALVLFVGYSQAATIREGREDEVVVQAVGLSAAAFEDQQPVVELKEPAVAVAELRKQAEPVVEAVDPVVEQQQLVEEAVAVAEIEQVVPLLRNVVEPLMTAIQEDPVAIVLAEKEIVSEVKAVEPVVVAIVEPEIAIRSTELMTDVVSELKAVPIQAVEEVAEPEAAIIPDEPVKAAVVEEESPVIALKSVPIEEPVKVEAPVAVAAPVVAVAEEKEQEAVIPAVKAIVQEAVEEAKPVEVVAAVVETEVIPAVEPVEGTQRQNAVEGEQRPTFLQQAQQVLTNNPITQFIQNNPLTNAIRGGTTSAPGSSDEAPAAATTARPGLFAQLFNPSTAAAAAPVAEETAPSTAAPGLLQQIQNALPQPNILANIQNIFSGNRANATAPAAPAAPAASEPARKPENVVAEAPSSNAIDQAKKKRLDVEVEQEAAPLAIEKEEKKEVKPVVLVATERLDAQVKEEQVVEAAEVKTQE